MKNLFWSRYYPITKHPNVFMSLVNALIIRLLTSFVKYAKVMISCLPARFITMSPNTTLTTSFISSVLFLTNNWEHNNQLV